MKVNLRSILIIIGVILVVSAAFFIVTATKSSPVVMELKMPKDGKDASEYKDISSKLTVVLLKNDMIYGYYGNNVQDGKTFALTELRKELLEGIKKYSLDSFVVVIKPLKAATYKNTVDVLDEMSINAIKRYAMEDASKKEKSFLKIDE